MSKAVGFWRHRAAGGRVKAGGVSWFWRTGLGALLALALPAAAAVPAAAAERIVFSYGIIERSVRVEQLERFAATGELDDQLQEYIRLFGLTPAQVEQFRQTLTSPADFDAVAVGQFLYTSQGKLLLKQVSQVVQTNSGQAGFSATRAALILAAADSEQGGLTLLNVLRYFPTEVMQVDVARGLAIVDTLNRTLSQSNQAIQGIQAQSAAAAAQVSPETLAELATILAQLEAERVYDVRVFDLPVPGLTVPADLYLPQPQPGSAASPFNRPVVVISHGLGSDRGSFAYLAEPLAEAGFVVLAVEHSGSNAQQLLGLLEGQTNFITPTEEFVDRPRAISLTLDALAERARRTPTLLNRIDLSRVGVIGQSFGGYTALVLAGATLDLAYLGNQCSPTTLTLNASLLLQCQAALLNDPGESLSDPRIRAAFVMNPVGSALFGPSGYDGVVVPTLVVASAADTVAPAFPEQIQPFGRMRQSDRYLALIDNGSHFSVIGDSTEPGQPIPLPPEVLGPAPELAQSYMEVLSLAFFKVYVEENDRFLPLLQSAFVENFISAEPLPLSLIQTLPADLSQRPFAADLTASPPADPLP